MLVSRTTVLCGIYLYNPCLVYLESKIGRERRMEVFEIMSAIVPIACGEESQKRHNMGR